MEIRTVGVLGAGQMGLGIAQATARAGYDTIMAKATRSLKLPVGFSHSIFTKMSAQSGGTTLRSLTSEVLPMASVAVGDVLEQQGKLVYFACK